MGVRDMRQWALLLAAIFTEVAGTLSLRASHDSGAWMIVVVVGYFLSFFFLTMVLRAGMGVGVAYGIWGALGTATTAGLASVFFDDPFTTAIMVGIGLIITGVLLVEFGSREPENEVAQ